MGQVTIGTDTFDIYGTYTAAVSYVNGMIGPEATKWRAASGDNQKRSLVAAGRMLDAQDWADDVVPTTEPVIIQASYELAVILMSQPQVQSQAPGSNVKSVKAGPTEVVFFRPQSGGVLPFVVQNLVSQFLEGRLLTGDAMSQSGGTDVESQFDDSDTYGNNGGL